MRLRIILPKMNAANPHSSAQSQNALTPYLDLAAYPMQYRKRGHLLASIHLPRTLPVVDLFDAA